MKTNKKIKKLQHKMVTKLLAKKYGWAVKSIDLNGDSMVINWAWK